MTTGPNTPDEPTRPPGEQPPAQQPPGQQPPPSPGAPPPGPAAPPPGATGTPPGAPLGPQGAPMPPQGMPMPPQQGRPAEYPPMRPDDEKLWAIAAHLGPLVVSFLAPLVVWLVFKDRSRFVDRQAKEALNMQISYLIYFLVAGVSVIVLVGLVLLPVVGIAWVVLMVIASIKAANFEDYRYPLIFRLVT